MAGNGIWADLSCHTTPDGAVSFSASNRFGASEADTVRIITASAAADTHGNITAGTWKVEDQQGTIMSVDFPDGTVGGRRAPTERDAAENVRENAGDLLIKTIDVCKRGIDLRMF